MPSLIRRPAVESLGARAVEDVDNRHHRLSLEDNRHSHLLEEGPSHSHNRLVAPLNDVIMLRAVRREVMAPNTLSRHEFADIIGVQHMQLVAALCLRSGLRATKDHNPHVAGEVIDEQREVVAPSRCCRCHRATQVPVHELEPLLGSEAQFLGKGEPPLLRQHTDVAELLHVVKAR
jgi:hypothetical protein